MNCNTRNGGIEEGENEECENNIRIAAHGRSWAVTVSKDGGRFDIDARTVLRLTRLN